MPIPREADGVPFPGGRLPGVVCAACGAQFDSAGATTGARVRCPLCREVVELDELVAMKRRYRTRAAISPRSAAEARRIPRANYRRFVRVVAMGLAIAGAAYALRIAWTTNRANVLGHDAPRSAPANRR